MLVALAQRYLRYEVAPRPLSRREVAQQLRHLHPDAAWSESTVGLTVDRVYRRADRRHARGSFAEVGSGSGADAALSTTLVASAVLVPPDLTLLGRQGDM